ncbi:hypothetical protein CC86DRAFT_53524 [Ophiobolus disseminans]|uniref:Uncharacterized protein n=1 Tax=Ophiobolus disseminans TaxID=1469910 RepID=A0A6A6ZTA1_9PLEO|nr:hypothetical protein CC86DRAFT_53524 [Ophiobolus disseminans]
MRSLLLPVYILSELVLSRQFLRIAIWETTPKHPRSRSHTKPDLTMTSAHLHMLLLRVSSPTQYARQQNSALKCCSSIKPHRHFNTTLPCYLSLISSNALFPQQRRISAFTPHTPQSNFSPIWPICAGKYLRSARLMKSRGHEHLAWRQSSSLSQLTTPRLTCETPALATPTHHAWPDEIPQGDACTLGSLFASLRGIADRLLTNCRFVELWYLGLSTWPLHPGG